MLKNFKFQYNYIPKDKEENLQHYKYAAQDHSLLYNHFFSPLANHSVQYIPEWIAPNLLTLGGLIFVLVPYMVLWYYTPWNLETTVPNWVYYFICVCHYIYFHLDNMDGKQARKTGNSSALGLVFDHGCDAISVYMQSTTIINCLNMGNEGWGILSLYIPSSIFYLTNLEEYYTHRMYLPIINPAIEGVVITGIILGLSGYMGQEAISAEYIMGFSIGKLIALFIISGAVISAPLIFMRIYQACGFGRMLQSIRKCWFMFYCHGIVLYFVYYSQIKNYTLRYAIIFLGFNMCKQLTMMLLASAGKYKFDSWSPLNFVIMTSFFINTYLAVNNKPHINEYYYLFFCLIISFIAYIHLVKNVADQMCRVLNIKCFTVKPIVKKQ